MPATIPSMAKPVVTPEETLMLSNGSKPVRINHRPSKSIPRLLPIKLVIAIFSPSLFFARIEAAFSDARKVGGFYLSSLTLTSLRLFGFRAACRWFSLEPRRIERRIISCNGFHLDTGSQSRRVLGFGNQSLRHGG